MVIPGRVVHRHAFTRRRARMLVELVIFCWVSIGLLGGSERLPATHGEHCRRHTSNGDA